MGACGARARPRKGRLVLGSIRSPSLQELTLSVGGRAPQMLLQRCSLPCPQRNRDRDSLGMTDLKVKPESALLRRSQRPSSLPCHRSSAASSLPGVPVFTSKCGTFPTQGIWSILVSGGNAPTPCI